MHAREEARTYEDLVPRGASFHEEGIHDSAGRAEARRAVALRAAPAEHGPWRQRTSP